MYLHVLHVHVLHVLHVLHVHVLHVLHVHILQVLHVHVHVLLHIHVHVLTLANIPNDSCLILYLFAFPSNLLSPLSSFSAVAHSVCR